MTHSRDEKLAVRANTIISHVDGDPNWWTDERVAVMEVLFRRSEFGFRTSGLSVFTWPAGRRCASTSIKTEKLYDFDDPVLTAQNVGPAIKALIDWGYLYKLKTSVARVSFTQKGWAWLAFKKKLDPEWFKVIFADTDINRAQSERLHKNFVSRDALQAVAAKVSFLNIIQDIMEPLPIMENLPFKPEEPVRETPVELPGLPEFSAKVEERIRESIINCETSLVLSTLTDIYGENITALEGMDVRMAISRHFSHDEAHRAEAELTVLQVEPEDSYYARELVRRMSKANEFKAPTLADHRSDDWRGAGHGVTRIAAALEAQELREQGLSRHMPENATLGDVHDRLRAEEARGISDVAVEASPENIQAASDAAKAEDDKMPMSDWIERQLSQYDYDGFTPTPQASKIARKAVFRHMRQNPAGARVMMSDDGPYTQFDGSALHVRRQIHNVLDGRSAMLTLSIDSDYDPVDTQNIENWFGDFVKAAQGNGTRNYTFPAGSKVEHEVVGVVEFMKITPGTNHVATFLSGALGGVTALLALMGILALIPNL